MQEKVKRRCNGNSEERGIISSSSSTEMLQGRHYQSEHTITTSHIKQFLNVFKLLENQSTNNTLWYMKIIRSSNFIVYKVLVIITIFIYVCNIYCWFCTTTAELRNDGRRHLSLSLWSPHVPSEICASTYMYVCMHIAHR